MRLFRCPFAEVVKMWWLWISRHQIGVPPRGDVQNQEGECYKTMEAPFFFVGRLRLWSETIIELIKQLNADL